MIQHGKDTTPTNMSDTARLTKNVLALFLSRVLVLYAMTIRLLPIMMTIDKERQNTRNAIVSVILDPGNATGFDVILLELLALSLQRCCFWPDMVRT